MKNKNVFEIVGGNKLNGEVKVQTSKNAVLPIMSACLLAKGKTILSEYPKISDLYNMISILKKINVEVIETEKGLELDTTNATNLGIDSRLSKTMRSSIFLLGSTLSRFNNVMITMPGGCDIGKRPIDIHLSAFKQLKVKVVQLGEYIFFNSSKAKAGKVKLKKPSVGATENIIQFATMLKGKTTIINAAREPEVVDLCNFLAKMGAKIYGIGTDKLTIYGVDKLSPITYRPMGDRIVAGTIMCAVAMCGGDVVLTNSFDTENLKLIEKLCSMGCQITTKNDIIHIISDGNLKTAKEISTGYYPDFATDLQSIMLVTSCVAKGETIVKENIFENRFLIADELKKMGAKIEILDPFTAKLVGVENFIPANVVAKDLRGGASLILAGLKADGKTKVSNIQYVDRGYENFEQVLNSLGAKVKRV